jgi:hypothetical protein
MAVLANVSTGYFVNRMPVMWVVLVSSALSAISPLLMAVVDPQWPYWYMAFIAQVSKLTTYNVLSSSRLVIAPTIFHPLFSHASLMQFDTGPPAFEP